MPCTFETMSNYKQRVSKRLSWLLSLMTLSLLGITAIQAYWLKNAYDLREEKFDNQVGLALDEVSERLEQMESLRFLFNSMDLKPIFSSRLNPTANKEANSAEDSLPSASFQLSMRLGADTLMVFNSGPEDSLFRQSLERDPSRVILEVSPDQMMRKGAQLDMLLRKMVKHELGRRKKDSAWIDQALLDSLLFAELNSKGVALPFEFAVLNDAKVVLSSSNWDPTLYQHSTALFPNDILSSEMLQLSFPSKARYIFQSLWVMLVISILFTGSISYTFYRTINFSLKQKRISEIKTDFINNMTHEFKTPIATINLAIDAMKNPKVKQDPARIEQYSNMIKQENQRMNLQVESVLRMALLDKQELHLDFKKEDIMTVIKGCLDHISLQLSAKDGKLQRFFNEQERVLSIDANHLSNTIINILDNAMKYSVGKPEIKVVTETTQSHFILIISDKGMGMTKDEQKHIFDRFYRVSAGDLHNIKGHGLGLSYAKGIVESHGGRIEVESEKGKGSKFYIYLPLNR